MLLKALGIPKPEFVISVSIAGEILEQNADEVRGSTLIWNFNILDPQPDFEPYAVVDTTVSSSGFLVRLEDLSHSSSSQH